MSLRQKDSTTRVWHEWESIPPELFLLFQLLSQESTAYVVLRQLTEKYPDSVKTDELLNLLQSKSETELTDIINELNQLAKNTDGGIEIVRHLNSEYKATVKKDKGTELYLVLNELTVFQKKTLLLLLRFEKIHIHDLEELMNLYGFAVSEVNNTLQERMKRLGEMIANKNLGKIEFVRSTRVYRFTINPDLKKEAMYESLLEKIKANTYRYN